MRVGGKKVEAKVSGQIPRIKDVPTKCSSGSIGKVHDQQGWDYIVLIDESSILMLRILELRIRIDTILYELYVELSVWFKENSFALQCSVVQNTQRPEDFHCKMKILNDYRDKKLNITIVPFASL